MEKLVQAICVILATALISILLTGLAFQIFKPVKIVGYSICSYYDGNPSRIKYSIIEVRRYGQDREFNLNDTCSIFTVLQVKKQLEKSLK